MDSYTFASVKQSKFQSIMKVRNILFALSALFIAASCSMDEDIDNVGEEIQVQSETTAEFEISLAAGNGVSTKGPTAEIPKNEDGSDQTEDANGNESSVVRCFLAVFECSNGQVSEDSEPIATQWYENSANNTFDKIWPIEESNSLRHQLGTHVILKVPNDLSKRKDLMFVAVAQVNPNSGAYAETSSLNALKAAATYGELMNTVLLENPTVFVKVGEKTLDGKSITTTDKLIYEHTPTSCNQVEIGVRQRSAAVELAEFKVLDESGKTIATEENITGVRLGNVVLQSKVRGAATDDIADAYGYAPRGTRFYTYENPATSEDKTYLSIQYKINDAEYERSYTIKSPGDSGGTPVERVDAGKLYKLHVTITHHTEDIRFVVDDWISNIIKLGPIDPEMK